MGEWVLWVDRRFRTHGPGRERFLYRKRGSVERVIGRLKEHTSLGENRARGMWRVEAHVQLCILCLLLSAYTAAVNQREDLVRSITRINQ
jgi:transposase